MEIIAYTLFIIVIIIDLIFYVPIKIHIYFDLKCFYLYVFAIPIIVFDEKKYLNVLKNKISIEKIRSSSPKDIKIIHSIKIKQLLLHISAFKAYEYASIIYPLLSISYINKNYTFKIKDNECLYLCVDVKFINFLSELIKIRKEKKHERKSYQ